MNRFSLSMVALFVCGLLISGCAVLREEVDPSDATQPWSSNVDIDDDSMSPTLPGSDEM